MSARRLYLVLDAGTSAGRALLFDSAGAALAEVATPWHYLTPADCAPWGREFDPSAMWAVLAQAAREALTTAAGSEVAAISVTGQRQATILVDEAGRELYGGPNVDLRACFEGARLLQESGERIHAITGHLPPMMFASARWLWFRDRRPEVCRRARHLFMMGDWLLWRLTGQSVTDRTNAAETGLFDVSRDAWSEELLAAVGLPSAILPELRPSGSPAGELSPGAAAELGLPPGTPVVVGATDTACGLLGLGAVAPGQVGIVAGWSGPLQMLLARPRFDPQRSLWTTCSALPGVWALEGNAGPCGSAHRWLRDLIAPGGTYDELDELASTVPPGSRGALALAGPRLADYGDPRLLWGGLLLPQANDLLPIGRAEFARATLENIAYAIRANLERVEAVAGIAAGSVALGGGLSRSRLFPRLLADVLGRPVAVSAQPSVSALGAAMCAAGGAGALPAAIAAMEQSQAVMLPERAAQAEYLDVFERWLQAYRGLEELSARLT